MVRDKVDRGGGGGGGGQETRGKWKKLQGDLKGF